MARALSAAAAFERWEATRRAGRRSYIIRAGILGWGIPVALAVTAWDWYNGATPQDVVVKLAIGLVLFGIVGGIAFGAAMWKVQGWIYAKAHARYLAQQGQT